MSKTSQAIARTIVCLTVIFQWSGSHAQPEVRLRWAKGILTDSYVGMESIARNASGNLYLTGYFVDRVDFDPGPGEAIFDSEGSSDIFIAKYDAAGNYVWVRCINGTHGLNSNSLTIDGSGNLYITGTFSGTVDMDPGPGTSNINSIGNDNDIFLAKYDSSGNHLWSIGVGGSSSFENGLSVAVDGMGNAYMTGYFDGTTDFDPGPGTNILTGNGNEDIFVAKYDGSGNHLWAFGMGGTGWELGRSIAVDASNNVYVTGDLNGTIDFDPGPGTANLTSNGEEDIFLAKYDESGRFVFAESMGGTSYEKATDMLLDENGHVYLTGEFYSEMDFDPGPGMAVISPSGFSDAFLAKYDGSGKHLWSRSMGDASSMTAATSVGKDGNGHAYITGYFSGNVDFDPGIGSSILSATGGQDVFLARYDASGNHVCSASFGGGDFDRGTSLTVDASGRTHVIGNFRGHADFDPGPGSSVINGTAKYSDGFIASYSWISTKTWIGGNGDWSTPANWSDGMTPNSEDILTVTNGNPRLDMDFTVAGSLTLSATGALTIQPGKTLSVSGTADFGGRPVIIRSDTTGTAQIGTVSGSLTGATQVTVERYIPNTGRRWRLLTAPIEGPGINAAWQNGQTWNGSSTLTGDTTGTLITGQQQMNAATANGRGFDFWSAIANSSASVMSYTQRTGQGVWSPLTNTSAPNAFSGDKAYLLFVRGPRASAFSTGTANASTTLRPTGTLKQGDRNIPIDGTKGYTLIGNPYPSQIHFDSVYLENGNSSVIKRQFWMWDARMGTTGNFIAVVFSGWKYVEVPARFHMEGDGSPLVDIPSGQGFFVLPLTSSGGTLRIREKHKTPKSSLRWPTILLNEDRTPRVWLNLVRRESDGSSLTADGVMAAYGETHRMESTDAEDAPKLENVHENIAILNDGASLTADARPTSKMQEPIALKTWNLSAGAYRFEAKVEHMSESGLKAFLEDRITGLRTPLRMEGGITSIDVAMGQDAASRAEDRFRIVFEKAAVNASPTPETDDAKRTMTVYPNPLTGRTLNIRLQNLPAGEYTLQLVGSDGRIVAAKKARHEGGSATYRIEMIGLLPKGGYHVRCLRGDKTYGTGKLTIQ